MKTRYILEKTFRWAFWKIRECEGKLCPGKYLRQPIRKYTIHMVCITQLPLQCCTNGLARSTFLISFLILFLTTGFGWSFLVNKSLFFSVCARSLRFMDFLNKIMFIIFTKSSGCIIISLGNCNLFRVHHNPHPALSTFVINLHRSLSLFIATLFPISSI